MNNNKNIPVEERLIFALDVADTREAKQMVIHLGGAVHFYKLGLELLMSDGYFELIDWLCKRNKKVFADIKFNDIPQTVTSAVKRLSKYDGVHFVTVHAQNAAIKMASKEKGDIKMLAVTVLTSLDQGDLESAGFKADVDVKDIVLSRARSAIINGCDGVISSGIEASYLRKELGEDFLIVCPGIRPVENTEDDQKRTVDVEEAFRNGADYIVMGRPLREGFKKYYGLNSPKEAALHIQDRIKKIFL